MSVLRNRWTSIVLIVLCVACSKAPETAQTATTPPAPPPLPIGIAYCKKFRSTATDNFIDAAKLANAG